jgi:hypothetical protein
VPILVLKNLLKINKQGIFKRNGMDVNKKSLRKNFSKVLVMKITESYRIRNRRPYVIYLNSRAQKQYKQKFPSSYLTYLRLHGEKTGETE